MKMNTSFTLNLCQSVGVGRWQPDTETTKRPSFSGWVLLIVMMLTLVVPLAAFSKGPPPGKGGGKGGGTVVTPDQVDYGDIFGDLIHIYRHEVTGQPIFAQRWVELPREEPGYGWGYCAIVETDLVLDDDGYPTHSGYPTRIPFAAYSCDLDTAAIAVPLADDFVAGLDTEVWTDEDIETLAAGLAAGLAADMIVEVDYFGRLNGARTRENNLRMHFDEVISNINQAVRLKLGPAGRLMLESCATWEYDPTDPTLENVCTSYAWSTIDSPMESLGLYTRLNRYGHLATDPLEEDLFWHGDPALYDGAVPPYPTHPALTETDFDKFVAAGLGHLLPATTNVDFGPEALTAKDFDSSAIFLGAAGSKTRWATVDLVQYLNRFLRISVATDDPNGALPPSSYEPVESLPALYEDCWSKSVEPDYQGEDVEEGEDPPAVDDLVYDECITCTADEVGNSDNTSCLTLKDADGDPIYPDNSDLYAKMQERFMNFANAGYTRANRPNVDDTLIMPFKGILEGSLYSYIDPDYPELGIELASTLEYFGGAFSAPQTVNLLEWMDIPNPLELNSGGTDFDYGSNIRNYVIGANDALRSIEFIHNYEVPADLYCMYLVDPDHLLWDLAGFDCPTTD